MTRFPTDHLLNSSYPIKCYSGFSDGFSGWYAVSHRHKCNDFCFWEINYPADDDDTTSYSATNVADPHQSTFLSNGKNSTSTWKCALNVASSDSPFFWSTAIRSRLTPLGYFGSEFPYLQCQRGAGEVLEDGFDEVATSEVFWWSLLTIGLILLLFQFSKVASSSIGTRLFAVDEESRQEVENASEEQSQAQFNTDSDDVLTDELISGNARTRLFSVDNDSRQEVENTSEEPLQSLLQKDSENGIIEGLTSGSIRIPPFAADKDSQQEGTAEEEMLITERNLEDETVTENEDISSVNQGRKLCVQSQQIILIIFLNIGILAVSSISIASLLDIQGREMLSDWVMRITPKCYNQYAECAAANEDIDRPSKERHSTIPFSYIVASDAQLDWYAGESTSIGKLLIPEACSPTDSCSSCTTKVGQVTNELVTTSMKMLISGMRLMDAGGSSKFSSNPTPKTVVMNGDLTAYFHPHERDRYESIYHNIDGLEHFFPALGNHEVALGSGAYGDDQWIGQKYCNSRHSLGYIRSGICGKIPNFDPNRIVRYDSSSLAYSWEEGRYHFVHTHYYPAFESAGINLKSSITWLERDISLAYQANMTTILFVHASQGLTDVLERTLLGKNVAAIFAGHTHRCLMRKCVFPVALYEDEMSQSSTENKTTNSSYDTCLPGSTGICGNNADLGGMSLYYVQNASDHGFVPPSNKLWVDTHIDEDRKLCPTPRKIALANNDTRLYCKRGVAADSDFPAVMGGDSSVVKREHIPIFWSGSASFQTFLKLDFFNDRFTVNAMTAVKGAEGKRYKDTHSLPNVVYPYHNEDDMDEVSIQL